PNHSIIIIKKMEHKFDSEAVIQEFECLTKDAKRVQLETLKKILKENGEAEYLKKWNLDGRYDPQTYSACVPVVTHKDLEPYIQKIADGKPKFVPFNDELTETTMQIYRTSFAFRNRYFDGCNQVVNGLGVVISSTFAHSIIHSFRTFELVWSELCSDIRTGTLSAKITVPSIRTAMAKVLTPNPDLADEIRNKCLGLSDWNGLIPEMFPNCKYIYAIMTGSMEPYLKKLRVYAGGVRLLSADYGSSEGWIGANVDPDLPPEKTSFTVLPNIGYFEFLPLGEINEAGSVEPELIGLTDVQLGEEYEVVVTNVAGLYRRNLMLNINIDKNTEKDLQLSVEKAAKLLTGEKLEVVDFTSHVDLASDPGHYVIFWEMNGEASDAVLQECCNCLDKSFVDAGYVSSRKVNAIGPLELRVLKRGTFQKILDHYVGLGSALNQFKTPRCVGPSNRKVLQILCNNAVKSYVSNAFG
ncbi:hypothetical protein M8C21_007729, partial [Ambrosia artemisiifolia]